jgi:hypothetical protein
LSPSIIVLAVTAIIILLLLSFLVVWRFDSQRLADHFARSTVQAAIAISSVLVAVVLFKQQVQERDAQALSQQRLVLASYLQTHMRQLVSRSKKMAPSLISDRYQCDPSIQACDLGEEDVVLNQRSELDSGVKNRAKFLQFSLPLDQDEFWKVMRDSPLVDETFFDELFESMNTYDNDVAIAGFFMDDVLEEYEDEKTKYDKEMVPPKTVEAYLNKLAGLQVREAKSVAQYICYLSDRTNELRGRPHANVKFELSIDPRSCPPYTDHFERLFAAAKLPPRSRF